jgi:hypothetical protein
MARGGWSGPAYGISRPRCPGAGGPQEAAEVRNSSHTALGIPAPKWAAARGVSLARNRGIVDERLGHDLREGGGGTLPVWVKAANRPDVGKDPGGDPSTGVL